MGIAIYRWICCNCGGDNNYSIDAGCRECNNHWRQACCVVYEAYKRGPRRGDQSYRETIPDEPMLSQHAPEAGSIKKADERVPDNTLGPSTTGSSSVALEPSKNSQKAIPRPPIDKLAGDEQREEADLDKHILSQQDTNTDSNDRMLRGRYGGILNDDPRVDDDGDSIVTSYANSVFSITSLASSTTNSSLHSKYSPTQILEATRELIIVLRDDKMLTLLYEHAIADTNIGPERLKRNLGRLFKNFAELLKEEAGDTLQFQASRLVSLKAKDVAQAVMDRYVKSDNASLHKKQKAQDRPESDSDDELETQPLHENMFGDLVLFREFLLHSDALVELRAQIRSFVLPKSGLQKSNSFPDVQVSPGTDQHIASSSDHISSYPKAFGIIAKKITAALVIAGCLEPPLTPGLTRLRWKCICGHRFYGDVFEHREGGVAKMIDRMQRSMGTRVMASSHGDGGSNQKYTFRAPPWIRNSVQKLAAAFGRSQDSNATLPEYNHGQISTHSRTRSPTFASQKVLHLMACIQRGRYRRVLDQKRIDHISTDRDLFRFMKLQSSLYHGHIRRYFSMKSVQGLYFVKFRLRVCGSTEVREHQMCCVYSPSKECECLPPISKVEPQPDAEYRCNPAGPPDTWPPILSQDLMHMLTSPKCINEGQTFVLEQLPKRTKGELKGSPGQPVEGWGIYYEEGWNIDLIIGIVLVVFLLASLLFGILWSCLKLDIQGAFGVSSYMVTASGIFIAWIANRAGKLE